MKTKWLTLVSPKSLGQGHLKGNCCTTEANANQGGCTTEVITPATIIFKNHRGIREGRQCVDHLKGVEHGVLGIEKDNQQCRHTRNQYIGVLNASHTCNYQKPNRKY